MSPLLADNVMINVSKMHAGHIISMQKNASSLSTESSEFEFDSCSSPELHDDPPLSPKLLYSPKGQRPLMASSNQFSDERAMHASRADHVEQHGFDDHLQYKAPPSVSRINHESANSGEEKKRMNLRSLLIRRDLEQLRSLINYYSKSKHQINKKDIKKQVPLKLPSPSSPPSLSASRSSSPVKNHANYYTNRCKLENYHPDYAGDVSPTESKSFRKKSRKWALGVSSSSLMSRPYSITIKHTMSNEFLRKSLNPRAKESLNESSIDKQANYCLNHGVFSTNQSDHCSISAAAEEPRVDDHIHERDHAAETAGEGSDYQFNDRIDRYSAAEAAGEARFNHHINYQINQSIDNYRGAAVLISKLESSRQSTISINSSVSSSPRRADNEMIKANHRTISKSAPISPAGSPPRSHVGGLPCPRSLEGKLSCLTANLS